MRIEEYLDTLTDQIRCRKARGPIREEIRCHIEDQAEAYRREGLQEEKAQEKAVLEMGDPVETGEKLDRIHQPKRALKEILIIGAFGIGGLLIQNSVQGYFLESEYQPIVFQKQIALLLVSFALMIGVYYLDYSRIGCRAKEITAGLFAALVLGKLFFGTSVNGREQWITIPGISLNIALAAQMFVPLYGGILYSYRGQGHRAVWKAVLWMFPGILLALWCPNAYIAIVLFGSMAIVFTLAVCRNWFLVSKKIVLGTFWGAAVLLPALGCVFILRESMSYRASRLHALVSAEGDLAYQFRFVKTLLTQSKWMGTGAEKGELGAVLEEHILTYAISYYGILAGILMIAGLALLFWHLFRISFRQKNELGRSMGVGCAGVLVMELILYVLGNLGILNIEGYCPFFTYGGTGMCVTFFLFGLLLSIHRYENILPKSPAQKKAAKYS